VRRAVCLLASAVVSAASLAGCTSGAEQPEDDLDLSPGVLAAEDLPDPPSSARVVESAPDLTPDCDSDTEAYWNDPVGDVQTVEYRGVDGASVVSAVYPAVSPGSTLSVEEEFRASSTSWKRCPAGRPAGQRARWVKQFPDLGWLEPVDLGAGRFGFRSLDKDRNLLGLRGFALAGQRTVQVSVFPETPGREPDIDVAALLDKAVARAEG